MPINSITITARPEDQEPINTYYIEYCGKTVFVHTTSTKIKVLIDMLGELDIIVDEWGELKDYCGIYEL